MMDTGSRAQFLLTFSSLFFSATMWIIREKIYKKFIKVRHGEGLDERWQRGFTHADTAVAWWCEKKS